MRPMLRSQGGSGGIVVCLGVGARNDLGELLGIGQEVEGEAAYTREGGGVEVWVVDGQRPWHLENVFGGAEREGVLADGTPGPIKKVKGITNGRVGRGYDVGGGGVIVWDCGDIEDSLQEEMESYFKLDEMPAIDERDEDELTDSEDEDERPSDRLMGREKPGKKRKSWSDREEEESEDDMTHPPQRRRSNSSSPIPESPTRQPRRGLMFLDGPDTILRSDAHERSSTSPSPAQPPKPPSSRAMRKQLLQLRAENEAVLDRYYSLGASYSEPIASMMYGLACDLGREDNDILWLSITGVSSYELSGKGETGINISTSRQLKDDFAGEPRTRIQFTRKLMQEEVRRLNPPDLNSKDGHGGSNGLIPTTARSPMDTGIRISPEPKFLLIRHWSLYDSMLHSPYLSSRLHVWTDVGRKKLHKMLAKMGVSLVQCKQSYTHMDMELKQGLRGKLIKYAEIMNLPELVPGEDTDRVGADKDSWGFVRSWGWRATLSASDVGVVVSSILEVGKGSATNTSAVNGDFTGWDRGGEVTERTDIDGQQESEEWVGRFWDAYDALDKVDVLLQSLPLAQHLHRAILRTGTGIIQKKQIRHLSSYRLVILKDGPDLQLFTHPSALTKLALWLGEAFADADITKKGKLGNGGRGTPLVVSAWNEKRGVYVVVGTGGGGGDAWGRGAELAKQKRATKDSMNAEKIAARKLRENEKRKTRELRREARELRRGGEPAPGQEEDETETESDDETESEPESDDDDDDDDVEEIDRKRGFGLNKFGVAFQEVVDETNARARVDSFENCVVEVDKDSLQVFLEGLSMKSVVG